MKKHEFKNYITNGGKQISGQRVPITTIDCEYWHKRIRLCSYDKSRHERNIQKKRKSSYETNLSAMSLCCDLGTMVRLFWGFHFNIWSTVCFTGNADDIKGRLFWPTYEARQRGLAHLLTHSLFCMSMGTWFKWQW